MPPLLILRDTFGGPKAKVEMRMNKTGIKERLKMFWNKAIYSC